MQVTLLMASICFMADCHVADIGDEFALFGISQQNALDCKLVSDLRYRAYRYVRYIDDVRDSYQYYARDQLWRDHYAQACYIERQWLKLEIVMGEWWSEDQKRDALKVLQKQLGKVSYYQGLMPEVIEVDYELKEEYDGS